MQRLADERHRTVAGTVSRAVRLPHQDHIGRDLSAPLTRTLRSHGGEVVIEPDDQNGLDAAAAARCQHVRAVAIDRITVRAGSVGPVALQEVRNTLTAILDR